MSDDGMMNFRMVIPKDCENETGLLIFFKHEDVQLTLSWKEDGTGMENLDGILSKVPEVVEQCRQERRVRLDILGLDGEIDDLLGDQ